jgi:seryl-tRNA synthetase
VTDLKTDLETLKWRLFRPMGADGVYARTGLYEGVVEALTAFITQHRPKEAEVFRFPPVMTRSMIERSGYLKSFPNLLGCMCCLGDDVPAVRKAVKEFEAGGDWTTALLPADLVLTPASCYPVYPIAAQRGVVPEAGYVFDVGCDCFRREPSGDLDRLQSFRMREYVRVGTPVQILAFREDWMVRAGSLADALGLSYRMDVASDPFFGAVGKFKAVSQVKQELKFELLVPIISEDKPTACMSFNYHQDHFGETWGLRDQAGQVSHTGCVAFGMDRLAVAMFATHGTDTSRWPQSVRTALKL